MDVSPTISSAKLTKKKRILQAYYRQFYYRESEVRAFLDQ